MRRVEILPRAAARMEEIHELSRDRWGEAQAERHMRGMFAAMERLAVQIAPSRAIPAPLGFDGYYFRYERHFVYWRHTPNGDINILTVTHEKQHQIDQLRDDLLA